MNRIGLKINGVWCVLPEDVSITIEEQNPLFSDSGSFSYPIELSVSQNRELFKSIDSPQGVIRPQDIDGLPFELWYDGNMLLYGSVEMDDDLDIAEDKCSVNLVSGNGDFKSKIEGMKCTDVPLVDDIYLGDIYTSAEVRFKDNTGFVHKKEVFLDEVNAMDFFACNVSEPYPVKPYCNVRVCTKRSDSYNKETESAYMELDADRPFSGLCFYVLYFIKCLFYHIGLLVNDDNSQKVEDMKRLAFFTTKCKYDIQGDIEDVSSSGLSFKNEKIDISLEVTGLGNTASMTLRRKKAYASSGNFPDVEVSDVVDSLFNAFGLKVVSNPKDNTVSLYYIRDILRDNDVIDIQSKVLAESVQYDKIKGVRLTYGDNKDDTAFKYNDFTKENVKTFTDYKGIINNIQANDKSCYVSEITGNKYRIKIDEEAEEEGDEKNLNPSLFEVAQYNDYIIGENSDEAKELKISFSPLMENDILPKKLMEDGSYKQQTLAVYIDDVELKKPGYEKHKIGYYSYWGEANEHTVTFKLKQYRYLNYDRSKNNDNPFDAHDSGFALGIMRGAGSKSKVVVSVDNYDGNGNSAWVAVADDYAFTSDSMDAYGNRYDYNGDIAGGITDSEDTISLKTHIQTAKDVGLKNDDGTDVDWGIDATAAKRGLADRFMSEYMYFLLHRKVVSMDVDTTLSGLTGLSWFKQLRINGTVGRLKSRTYTLSNKGVKGMGIELYTIN